MKKISKLFIPDMKELRIRQHDISDIVKNMQKIDESLLRLPSSFAHSMRIILEQEQIIISNNNKSKDKYLHKKTKCNAQPRTFEENMN